MEELERQYAAAAATPRKFTYKQLAKATKNFSNDNLLGNGGFGSVYKGHIVDPPKTIAVKKISDTSQQGNYYFFFLFFLRLLSNFCVLPHLCIIVVFIHTSK